MCSQNGRNVQLTIFLLKTVAHTELQLFYSIYTLTIGKLVTTSTQCFSQSCFWEENRQLPWKFAAGRNFSKSYTLLLEYTRKNPSYQMRFLDAKLTKTAHAAGPVLQTPRKSSLQRSSYPIAGLEGCVII